MAICACGNEHHRSVTGPCPKCYMKQYRATAKGKENVKQANKRWTKNNPVKRALIVERYTYRRQAYVPVDLWELRLAQKTLEHALAAAQNGTRIHRPSQRGRDKSVERANRHGHGQGLCDFVPCVGPDRIGGGHEIQVSPSES